MAPYYTKGEKQMSDWNPTCTVVGCERESVVDPGLCQRHRRMLYIESENAVAPPSLPTCGHIYKPRGWSDILRCGEPCGHIGYHKGAPDDV